MLVKCHACRVGQRCPASVTLPWCEHSGVNAAFCTLLNGSGKALLEVLAVADAISPPMAGPRVNANLSRHSSVRLPLQRGGNRIWSRLPQRDCHATKTMLRLTRQHKRRSKCRIRSCPPASGPAWQQDPRRGCLDQRRWPEQVVTLIQNAALHRIKS